jgi:hypothetical protein
MSRPFRLVVAAPCALAFPLLCATVAAQTPPPSAPPGVPRPADPAPRPTIAPVAARVALASARPPKAPSAEPLPEPELRVRVIAPSARAPWTLRIENEGSVWVRVPADLRLLHLVVESGDSMGRRADKPVKCVLPAGLRLDAFPERNALLLGPGDSYAEDFDPRFFCFGKEAAAILGGAVVHATYGWDAPKGARKLGPPFAIEGTLFPAVVQPTKEVAVPSFVLSWQPPASVHPAPSVVQPEPPPVDTHPEARSDADELARALPVDENAPRLELVATPHVDAGAGHAVTLSVTLTNVGHRDALAAVRARGLGFVVDGPDGEVFCGHEKHISIAREGFTTLRPGASTSLSVLVAEACRQDLFRRPGLYRVRTTLHLTEDGAEHGLAAMTGAIRARETTLVRIAEGPEPFYRKAPQATRAARPELEPNPSN